MLVALGSLRRGTVFAEYLESGGKSFNLYLTGPGADVLPILIDVSVQLWPIEGAEYR